MFGLIRILLLLVIIAAVALLIRPDLIGMTGLPGSKPPQSKETAVSAPAPVAEQQVSESATTTEADSPKPVEQTVVQTAENATPEETITPQQKDSAAESDAPQAGAPGHDPGTLKQSDTEWGFDSSQEAISAPQSAPTEEMAAPQESDTATESGTPQKRAPGHDPETLKQSDTEWGFDSSQEAAPDADNAAPEASDMPQESDTGTTDTAEEAALRQEVEELLKLAADIIDNPEQK